MASPKGQRDNEARCPTCKMQFFFPGARDIHWRFSECRYKCSICADGLSHGSEQALQEHWHTQHERVYCSKCQKVCISRRALLFHDCENGNRCYECHMHLPSPAALNDLYRVNHSLRFCCGCNSYYRDVEGESKRHRRGCFGPEGFGSEASESEGDEANEKGESEGKEEKPKSNDKEGSKRNDQSSSAGDKPSPKVSDLYGLLKVHPFSSQAEIAQAARRRRIEVHPDKLKKPGMTDLELTMIDEMAMEVGFAADILQDAERRGKHDRERRERKQQTMKRRWGSSHAR